MASSLSVLLILALAVAASARTYLQCSCSPSSRGFRVGAINDLTVLLGKTEEGTNTLLEQMKTDPSVTRESIENTIQEKVLIAWKACVNNFNTEECVNADAKLRLGKPGTDCYPNCDSVCKFDESTWKNRDANNKVAANCDTIVGLKSNEQSIIDGNPEEKSAVRPGSANVTPPKKSQTAQTSSAASNSTEATPTPSDVASATTTPTPGTASAAGPTASPVVDTPTVDRPAGEGCVAVEHLEGYVLQHPTHLRRAVLCAHGFCATPNHAIIVGGELTSMKKLCSSKWSCVRSVKMVNNLKLAANRRAVVNELITVTPYDLRFPKAAVWAVQMLEDVVNLVGFSVAAGGVAMAAFLLSSKISA